MLLGWGFVPIEVAIGGLEAFVDALLATAFGGDVGFFETFVSVDDIDLEGVVEVRDSDIDGLAVGMFEHIGEDFLIDHEVVVGYGRSNAAIELGIVGMEINLFDDGEDGIIGEVVHAFDEVDEVIVFGIEGPNEVANGLDGILAEGIELREEVFFLFGAILGIADLGSHCFEDVEASAEAIVEVVGDFFADGVFALDAGEANLENDVDK